MGERCGLCEEKPKVTKLITVSGRTLEVCEDCKYLTVDIKSVIKRRKLNSWEVSA